MTQITKWKKNIKPIPMLKNFIFHPLSRFLGIFLHVFLLNTASSVIPQIPLCKRIRKLNPELLRLWHWQSDALSIWRQVCCCHRSIFAKRNNKNFFFLNIAHSYIIHLLHLQKNGQNRCILFCASYRLACIFIQEICVENIKYENQHEDKELKPSLENLCIPYWW